MKCWLSPMCWNIHRIKLNSNSTIEVGGMLRKHLNLATIDGESLCCSHVSRVVYSSVWTCNLLHGICTLTKHLVLALKNTQNFIHVLRRICIDAIDDSYNVDIRKSIDTSPFADGATFKESMNRPLRISCWILFQKSQILRESYNLYPRQARHIHTKRFDPRAPVQSKVSMILSITIFEVLRHQNITFTSSADVDLNNSSKSRLQRFAWCLSVSLCHCIRSFRRSPSCIFTRE